MSTAHAALAPLMADAADPTAAPTASRAAAAPTASRRTSALRWLTDPHAPAAAPLDDANPPTSVAVPAAAFAALVEHTGPTLTWLDAVVPSLVADLPQNPAAPLTRLVSGYDAAFACSLAAHVAPLATPTHPSGPAVTAVVPASPSPASLGLLKALGADVVRTLDGWAESALQLATRLAADTPGAAFPCVQPAHWQGWVDCHAALLDAAAAASGVLVVPPVHPDIAVAFVRCAAPRWPSLRFVLVQMPSETGAPASFPPAVLQSLPRNVQTWSVTRTDAYRTAHRVMRREKLLIGPLTGAAISALVRLRSAETVAQPSQQQQQQQQQPMYLTILADSATLYPDTLLDEEYLIANDMADPPAADAALKYRGASVEDLQLAAVVTVTETSTLGEALDRMLSHDFSQLPVISKSRKIFGFVTLASINQALHHGYPVAAEEGGAAATGPAPLTDPVSRCMYRFKARKDAGYMTITPATPLADLEPFFEKHAAGFVTDDTGRFPLAVVTKYDLLRFLSRRGVR